VTSSPTNTLTTRSVVVAALSVLALTAGAVTTLWWAGTRGLTGTDLVTARFDALKIGLSIGVGGGGVFALYLAWRRQRSTELALRQKDQDLADVARAYALQERVAMAAEADAAARRITDQYTKAADQLGSDKAPVRLAGLYALERLAQDNPEQRQSIVNVFCAYLRMPFDPPATDAGRDTQEELLVRKAAQNIICGHLGTTADDPDADWPDRPLPDDPTFWAHIDLDLTGATLMDFSLPGCRVATANFSHARFIGGANFAHTEFDVHAYFKGARFEGSSAHFFGASFGFRAVFADAHFGEDAVNFEGATFCGMTFFRGAALAGGATMAGARALTDFNTSWGDARQWPPGWTERVPDDGEVLPKPLWTRWNRTSPGYDDRIWSVVVPDPG
jgi:hypothetical protein